MNELWGLVIMDGNKLRTVVDKDTINTIYHELIENPEVKAGLAFLEADNEQTAKEQIHLTSIPAPSFKEYDRGEFMKKQFISYGLEDVTTDSEGNIIGIRRGTESTPRIVISAHQDTVFPEGTETKATIRSGKIFAPGISDDGRGLAVLLTLLRSLNHSKIQTVGDLVFVATVGEEGLGDLRGVKALFEQDKTIDGFISIEPGTPEEIIYLATGSYRYHVTFKGPGGHSFGAFGTPSAVHAMGRAIAKLADMRVPSEPKTTFTVGTVTGGTSINTIAADATMSLDLRSSSYDELNKLKKVALSHIYSAVEEENHRWNTNSISVDINQVGDRPAGEQSKDAIIVQAAIAAVKAIGLTATLEGPSSTDSNVPISLGIPAVTLGGGGDYGHVHTLNEYFDPEDAFLGAERIFLTCLGLVGVHHVSQPLIKI